MKTQILVSTFNGERFLANQLQSLRDQTYTDFEILIRDDGSSDNTIEIIEDFLQKDSRIKFVKDKLGNLGVVQSFSKLLEPSLNSDMIFFCDQDDVWKADKVKKTVDRFLELDGLKERPLAIHTDLAVCDQNLNVIRPSMKLKTQAQAPHSTPLMPLLAQNYVTGCTLAMNRNLSKRVFPFPKECLMHDWWIGLMAWALGKLEFIPESLVCYRQHSLNASGSADPLNLVSGFKKLITQKDSLSELMKKRFLQSISLEKRLSQNLWDESSRETFLKLKNFHNEVLKGPWSAIWAARKAGIKLATASRTWLYYFLLVTEQKELKKLLNDSSRGKARAP